MIRLLSRNIIQFIAVVLIQVLLLNNIQVSSMVNPYFYVLFILLLPFETPGWLLLASSFFLGLTLDLFMNTPGMHSIASVLMAFLRPTVLTAIAPRDGYDAGTYPRLMYYGFEWFLKYTVVLVLIHHLMLFYIEVFRLSEFFSTFIKVIFSSLISVILIVLSQYFIFRK
jgi:rod shape-determining protein MreD